MQFILDCNPGMLSKAGTKLFHISSQAGQSEKA